MVMTSRDKVEVEPRYQIPRDPGCTTPGGAGTMPMPVPRKLPVEGDILSGDTAATDEATVDTADRGPIPDSHTYVQPLSGTETKPNAAPVWTGRNDHPATQGSGIKPIGG
jgi:hypothetical protein